VKLWKTFPERSTLIVVVIVFALYFGGNPQPPISVRLLGHRSVPSGKKERFSARWIPKCIHTDPVIVSIGWNEDEAGRAALDPIAHSKTFRLLTEDERAVVTPLPTMVKILVQAESRRNFARRIIAFRRAGVWTPVYVYFW
jgi:pyruvate/2-oxoglutarate dehydrogenase complex dihydrolipoamide dehydrogenase (E3) component